MMKRGRRGEVKIEMRGVSVSMMAHPALSL